MGATVPPVPFSIVSSFLLASTQFSSNLSIHIFQLLVGGLAEGYPPQALKESTFWRSLCGSSFPQVSFLGLLVSPLLQNLLRGGILRSILIRITATH